MPPLFYRQGNSPLRLPGERAYRENPAGQYGPWPEGDSPLLFGRMIAKGPALADATFPTVIPPAFARDDYQITTTYAEACQWLWGVKKWGITSSMSISHGEDFTASPPNIEAAVYGNGVVVGPDTRVPARSVAIIGGPPNGGDVSSYQTPPYFYYPDPSSVDGAFAFKLMPDVGRWGPDERWYQLPGAYVDADGKCHVAIAAMATTVLNLNPMPETVAFNPEDWGLPEVEDRRVYEGQTVDNGHIQGVVEFLSPGDFEGYVRYTTFYTPPLIPSRLDLAQHGCFATSWPMKLPTALQGRSPQDWGSTGNRVLAGTLDFCGHAVPLHAPQPDKIACSASVWIEEAW